MSQNNIFKCSKFQSLSMISHNSRDKLVSLSQRGLNYSDSNQVCSRGDPPDIALRIISVWVKPCCPGLCLPNETPCPWFLSVLRLTSPLLLHPGKRRRRRREVKGRRRRRRRRGQWIQMQPPPHLPSHIICMCRIRNDIHREPVRRESWRTKKKRRRRKAEE